jgi:hypothetical protein
MIRHLALEWMHESGYQQQQGRYPSFGDFSTWLEGKHYNHYFNFRSRVGALSEAEGWFESEIKDHWRTRIRVPHRPPD